MNTLTIETVEGLTYEVPVDRAGRPNIGQVIRAYARLTGLTLDDLTGRSQAAPITGFRHELMWLVRRIDPTASFTLIGRFLGGRDMATVHEAIAKVEQRLQRERLYAEQLAAVTRQVIAMAQEEARAQGPATQRWQLLAATQVLRDGELTDAEARRAALTFLQQLEGPHA